MHAVKFTGVCGRKAGGKNLLTVAGKREAACQAGMHTVKLRGVCRRKAVGRGLLTVAGK